MGQSTDAILCFGYAIEELPAAIRDDEDEWWRTINGYKPPVELYDERGEYIGGKRPAQEKISEYYDHLRAWGKAHPMPVEFVAHCSGDYPMYIIAVVGTKRKAHRGYPEEVTPAELVVTPEQIAALTEFCEAHGIETEGPPKWWLCSWS